MFTKHPIDFETLNKGDVIPKAMLQRIFGVEPTAFQLLKLRQQIMDETGFTVQIQKDELHILTDPEASQYNYHQTRVGIRKINKSHQRNLNVDTGELTDDQRIDHQRRLLRAGATVAAINQASRKPESFLFPEKRKTPVLAAV